MAATLLRLSCLVFLIQLFAGCQPTTTMPGTDRPVTLAAATGPKTPVGMIYSNDVAGLRLYLTKQRPPFIVSEHHNRSLLHFAAQAGRPEIIEMLIDAGEKVDVKDDGGNTPLHEAAGSDRRQVVRLLLNRGSDINARNARNETPLMLAASFASRPTVEAFYREGLSFESLDSEGHSAVALAALKYRKDIVQSLLDEGAKPDVRAILCLQDVDDLAKKITKEMMAKEKGLLRYAIEGGLDVAASHLLNVGADANEVLDEYGTLMHLAAGNNQCAIMRMLAAKGVKYDVKDSLGGQPLHWAARGDSVAAARMLLDHGAKVDSKDNDGCTPLMMAAGNASADTVFFLLSRGADPNTTDTRGYAALHVALGLVDDWPGGEESQMREVVKLLVRFGADVNLKRDGLRIIDEAKERRRPLVKDLQRYPDHADEIAPREVGANGS